MQWALECVASDCDYGAAVFVQCIRRKDVKEAMAAEDAGAPAEVAAEAGMDALPQQPVAVVAVATSSKLPAAAIRQLTKKRQADAAAQRPGGAGKYLTRMDAAERDVSIVRRELECMRTEFNLELLRVQAQLHKCMAAMPQKGLLDPDTEEGGGGGGYVHVSTQDYSVPFEQLVAMLPQ